MQNHLKVTNLSIYDRCSCNLTVEVIRIHALYKDIALSLIGTDERIGIPFVPTRVFYPEGFFCAACADCHGICRQITELFQSSCGHFIPFSYIRNNAAARQKTHRCSLYQAMASSIPFSKEKSGSYLSSVLALEISALLCMTSPARGGPKFGSISMSSALASV